MSNFWDDQDGGSFIDGMEAADASDQLSVQEFQHIAHPTPKRVNQVVQQVLEEDPATTSIDDEDDFADVLSDARLRLEQGRLYEMLMNHNLFEGVAADSKAIRNVQREIRKYAKERMEIMLGMRKSEEIENVENVQKVSPFSEMEVSVLKMLAKAASKGATGPVSAPQSPPRQTIAPIKVEQPAAEKALTPMVAPKKVAPPVKKAVAPKPPVPSPKAPTPLKRKKADDLIAKVAAEEGVPRQLLEEDYKALKKDPSEMTEEEIVARNLEASKRLKKQVKPTNAAPMLPYEQQVMKYQMQASEVAQQQGMSLLLAAIDKKNSK